MNTLFPTVARSGNLTCGQDLKSAGSELIRAIKSVAIACLVLYITYRVITATIFYTKAYLHSAIRSGMSLEGQQTIRILSGLSISIIAWIGLRYSIDSGLKSCGPIWNGIGHLAFAATGRE